MHSTDDSEPTMSRKRALGEGASATDPQPASGASKKAAPTPASGAPKKPTVIERAIEELQNATRIGAVAMEDLKEIGLLMRTDEGSHGLIAKNIADLGGAILESGGRAAAEAPGTSQWGISPLEQHMKGVSCIQKTMHNITTLGHASEADVVKYFVEFEMPLADKSADPNDGQLFYDYMKLVVGGNQVLYMVVQALLRAEKRGILAQLIELRTRHGTVDGSSLWETAVFSGIVGYLEDRVKTTDHFDIAPYIPLLRNSLNYMAVDDSSNIKSLLVSIGEWRVKWSRKLAPELCEPWCSLWTAIISLSLPKTLRQLNEDGLTMLMGVVDAFDFRVDGVPECIMTLAIELSRVLLLMPRPAAPAAHYSHLLYYWWVQRIPVSQFGAWRKRRIEFNRKGPAPWMTNWGFWENTLHECIKKCGDQEDDLDVLDLWVLLATPKLAFARLFMLFHAARDVNGMKCCLRGLIVAGITTEVGYYSPDERTREYYAKEALPPHMLRHILELVISDGAVRTIHVHVLADQLLRAGAGDAAFGVSSDKIDRYFGALEIPAKDKVSQRLVLCSRGVVSACPSALKDVSLRYPPVLSARALRFLDPNTGSLRDKYTEYYDTSPPRPAHGPDREDVYQMWKLSAPAVIDASLTAPEGIHFISRDAYENIESVLEDAFIAIVKHHISRNNVELDMTLEACLLQFNAFLRARELSDDEFGSPDLHPELFTRAWMAACVLFTPFVPRNPQMNVVAGMILTLLSSENAVHPIITTENIDNMQSVYREIVTWSCNPALPLAFRNSDYMDVLLHDSFANNETPPELMTALIICIRLTQSCPVRTSHAQSLVKFVNVISRSALGQRNAFIGGFIAAIFPKLQAVSEESRWTMFGELIFRVVEVAAACALSVEEITKNAVPFTSRILHEFVAANRGGFRHELRNSDRGHWTLQTLEHAALWSACGSRAGGVPFHVADVATRKNMSNIAAALAWSRPRSFESASHRHAFRAWREIVSCGVQFVSVREDANCIAWLEALQKFAENESDWAAIQDVSSVVGAVVDRA